ncbi:nucleoside 2-deoxyribosyltransferase domain-containing protein [Archangium sp.]|uniref:nucleoside 2-deoxyribosyltransferase domain-containing protein n=1 Tax=Archangium sp. TaxID=1872627 RepID=UPI002ED88FD5
MARILKPPMPLEWSSGERTLFLAGSIEMGSAPPWQAQVEQALADTSVVLLNPRRDDWDASWSQEASDSRFRGQVEWELEAQERADLIAMYFAPATRAPITLLELGLFARSGKLVVCCPPHFWRKGNVDVVCQRYGIRTVESLDALVTEVRRVLAP